MIYLLQDCYKDSSGEYKDILKIGYSMHSFRGSRGRTYKSCNFGFNLLKERLGSRNLEKKLHEKFKSLKLDGEWFEYSEDIIQGFSDIKETFVPEKINFDMWFDKIYARLFDPDCPYYLFRNYYLPKHKELEEEFNDVGEKICEIIRANEVCVLSKAREDDFDVQKLLAELELFLPDTKEPEVIPIRKFYEKYRDLKLPEMSKEIRKLNLPCSDNLLESIWEYHYGLKLL